MKTYYINTHAHTHTLQSCPFHKELTWWECCSIRLRTLFSLLKRWEFNSCESFVPLPPSRNWMHLGQLLNVKPSSAKLTCLWVQFWTCLTFTIVHQPEMLERQVGQVVSVVRRAQLLFVFPSKRLQVEAGMWKKTNKKAQHTYLTGFRSFIMNIWPKREEKHSGRVVGSVFYIIRTHVQNKQEQSADVVWL